MDRIQQLYHPDQFQKLGAHLISFLSDYLRQVSTGKIKTNPYASPEKALQSWEDFMASDAGIEEYFEKIVKESIHVHSPLYLGHQVSTPAPIAAFGGLVSDLLNNGMAVYEMGGSSNPLEKMATEMICKAIGYTKESAGFMTSGGTLANLTALLTARSIKSGDDVWEKGSYELKLGVMVSEQAHYCIDRAVRIMGLGAEGIIKLPVDDAYRVNIDMLGLKLKEARQKGIKVFAIVASSCSTATGSYDDIEAMADFAEQHDLWLHVDGAHGGAVVFSDQYRHLVNGIERADSVIIDCHKMMMTPTLCTAVLYKNQDHTLATFRQKADYLFDVSEQYDWWNSGKRTFECTKLMMSIKLMAIVRFVGQEVFGEVVDRLYNMAKEFASMIQKDPDLTLALAPQANIVCYRYNGSNELNRSIRQRILEEGKFYIVQTVIDDTVYLRSAVMNPIVELHHFKALIEEIKGLASEL
ncbi:pyridoxal phosphate-dependent decarboxylase family protein [Portibacter marinus]|uniref:pyridoxal phosphate-dependent decarboxylase family protein n=1 Tax=Portibacter marinus TaxID=2898660 RepID=UPI001F2FEF1B|nr:aminotransferase class I/II-fold pyridoxal phosphate-dependent enzyme [Portibacter marinus]